MSIQKDFFKEICFFTCVSSHGGLSRYSSFLHSRFSPEVDVESGGRENDDDDEEDRDDDGGLARVAVGQHAPHLVGFNRLVERTFYTLLYTSRK